MKYRIDNASDQEGFDGDILDCENLGLVISSFRAHHLKDVEVLVALANDMHKLKTLKDKVDRTQGWVK